MDFEIREYRDEDELEWMELHAKIMTISQACLDSGTPTV